MAIAHRFQGDGSTGRELGEESLDRPGRMVDPCALDDLAVTIEDGEERKVLARPRSGREPWPGAPYGGLRGRDGLAFWARVRVTTDLIMGMVRHVAPPVHWLSGIC